MKKHFKKTLFCIIFLSGFLVWGNASAANWYVDNEASGSDNGTSWTNAWPSFASIIWASIQPGDTLYISGGTESKTYSERLVVGASGDAGNPITIQVGQDSGHNGIVIIDGATTGNYSGITIQDKHYVKVSGQVGTGSSQNIKVQNFYFNGVYITGAPSNLEIAYIETEQNDRAMAAGAYGFRLSSTALATGLQAEIHHCKFHNNQWDSEVIFNQTYTGARTSYDQIKFHDNEIYDAHNDWLNIQAEGVSVYDNIFGPRGVKYVGHPDVIQAWSGYCKIYNNTFAGVHIAEDNAGNSMIRFNPQTSNNPDPSYIWIYNNLFHQEQVAFYESENYQRGIELSPQPGTTLNHLYFMNNTMVGVNFFGFILIFNTDHTTSQVSDIVIANNLFQDCSIANNNTRGANSVISLGEGGDGSITFGKWGDSVDVIFDYNTVYASSVDWSTNSKFEGINYSWANFISQSGTNTHPANATQNPALNANYKPTVNSPYSNAGVDLSAYFTTDNDGNARSNWSIGAYEYTGADDIIAPASPTGLSVQ